MPPFRLYGLFGCPHCAEAEQFLANSGVPVQVLPANEDPIMDGGAAKLFDTGTASYPILVCFPFKEVVVGYKEDAYRRLVEMFKATFPNQPTGGKDASGESSAVSA